jgi:hypothetical protein
MTLGRALTRLELDLVHLVADEVREHGKANAPSYLGLLSEWRVIVDAVLSVDDDNDELSIDALQGDEHG